MIFYIGSQTAFTSEEALQLFRNSTKNLNVTEKILRGLFGVGKYIPLAVSLICRLKLSNSSFKDWQGALDFAQNFHSHNALYPILELCTLQLHEEMRRLFRMLCVFKDTKVSVHSISCLWGFDYDTTVAIISEFSDKSLITYITGDRQVKC